MNWIGNNAAAIQALSSLAALILTGVLAGLTYKYVRLTRDIASSSLEQIEHIREVARIERQRNALALESLARRIRVSLGELRSEAPGHMDLRRFSQLEEHDISDIEGLSRQVNSQQVLASATSATVALRVIHGMVQKAGNIPEGMGWTPTSMEVQLWKKAMEDASRSLQEIERLSSQAANT